MRKKQTALDAKYIGEARKTLTPLGFLKPEQLAILLHPEAYPATNRPRLHSALTAAAQSALRDANTTLNYLPDTYVERLLTSQEFKGLMLSVNRRSSAVDKKQHHGDTGNDSFSLTLSIQMLNYALQGIIDNVPMELREALKVQLYPFVLTLNSIAAYSVSVGSKKGKRIPRIEFPWDLRPNYPSPFNTSGAG